MCVTYGTFKKKLLFIVHSVYNNLCAQNKMITKNNYVKHKQNTNTIIVHLSYFSHISVLRYCKNIKARLCSLLH